MSLIKVSIIVPVYNVENYLERCLESLINQSLREIEIIIVDDGSKDKSSIICDLYEKKDTRVTVIHKQNQGLGMARNTGMDIARGEYIVFVDSDDFVSTNAYKEMYDQIKKDDSDMLMTNYYMYNTLNDDVQEVKSLIRNQKVELEDIKRVACHMIGSNPYEKELGDLGMAVWKNMYSRKFLEKNSFRFCSEREYVSEDAVFHLMVVPKMKRISMMTNSYYYYCNNGDRSLSATFRESKFEEYKTLYRKELDLLELGYMVDFGKCCIATTFLGNIRAHFKQLMAQNYTMSEKRRIAKKIVNDGLVQSILRWYPYNRTTIKQRLFSIMLRIKCIDLLMLFGKLQSLR